MSQSRIALVVLFFAALLGAPAPHAQAASTVLCTGYTSCSGKGYSHAGYAEHKGTSYWNMYTGTNCTNYAAYRLITTNGLPNKRPAPGVGNARDWGTAMASVTDSTPAVGAIAWWGKTGNHVAYIEKVVSSSEIWVSESNWSGAFDWRKITKSGGGWPDGIIHFTKAAFTNTATPTISGGPKVGVTSTASNGSWSPAPTSFAYQWLANGAPIGGATAKTYKPTASLAGKTLSVSVTGTRSGYPAATATSSAVTVAPGTVTVSAAPTISGTPQVGKRLSATTGTWSRSDLTFSFQWSSGGAPIGGATGSSYVARSTDLSKPLSVSVTARRSGYSDATAVATTSAVAPGVLVRKAAPGVTGSPRVGARLTASPGTWSPTATVTYQWYAGGTAVAGATEPTFVPSARERGAAVHVRVTAGRPGFTSASATSTPTAALAAGHIGVSRAPAITGKPLVGTKLSIDAGAVTPAGAAVRYQWLRDGKAVSGATGRSRTVSSADLGHRISARVTYKATGYSARSATTPTTARVRLAPKISVAASSPAAGKVAFVVKVSARGAAAPTGSITVRDGRGAPRTVKVVRGRAAFTLSGQQAGRHTYRVTFKATTTIGSATKDKTFTVR